MRFVLFFILAIFSVSISAEVTVEEGLLKIHEGNFKEGNKILEDLFDKYSDKNKKSEISTILAIANNANLRNDKAYYAKYSLKYATNLSRNTQFRFMRIIADISFKNADLITAKEYYLKIINSKDVDSTLNEYVNYMLGWVMLNNSNYLECLKTWRGIITEKDTNLKDSILYNYGKTWLEAYLKKIKPPQLKELTGEYQVIKGMVGYLSSSPVNFLKKNMKLIKQLPHYDELFYVSTKERALYVSMPCALMAWITPAVYKKKFDNGIVPLLQKCLKQNKKLKIKKITNELVRLYENTTLLKAQWYQLAYLYKKRNIVKACDAYSNGVVEQLSEENVSEEVLLGISGINLTCVQSSMSESTILILKKIVNIVFSKKKLKEKFIEPILTLASIDSMAPVLFEKLVASDVTSFTSRMANVLIPNLLASNSTEKAKKLMDKYLDIAKLDALGNLSIWMNYYLKLEDSTDKKELLERINSEVLKVLKGFSKLPAKKRSASLISSLAIFLIYTDQLDLLFASWPIFSKEVNKNKLLTGPLLSSCVDREFKLDLRPLVKRKDVLAKYLLSVKKMLERGSFVSVWPRRPSSLKGNPSHHNIYIIAKVHALYVKIKNTRRYSNYIQTVGKYLQEIQINLTKVKKEKWQSNYLKDSGQVKMSLAINQLISFLEIVAKKNPQDKQNINKLLKIIEKLNRH